MHRPGRRRMIYIILDMYTGFTDSKHPGTVGPSSFQGGGRASANSRGFILLFILFIFILPVAVSGQKKSDIGIIGGTSYYLGDVNHSRHFYSPSPAGGLLWRYNFNARNSIRFSGIYAGLKGNPGDFDEPYPNSGLVEFSANLVDVGMSTEFNFMPYMTTETRKERYSPYVSAGLGYSIVLGGTSTLNLSFGGGFKYNVTTRLSTGAEWTFRKTFNDEIDNVQNIGFENNSVIHNKDWYSIVGIFVTYKLWDWGLDCAAYE